MKLTFTYILVASLFCSANLSAITSCSSDNSSKTVVTNNNQDDYVVKTISSELEGSKILKTIKDTYAGKVVLVDIWATWCPPCRAAMKTIDAIKPALQKKGVVFVYLTGETSPEETWKKMIPSIAGDHYRITNMQWKDMCRTLKMRGIPAYMVINKDGSEAYSNVTKGGYPGNEIIQNEIEAALSK